MNPASLLFIGKSVSDYLRRLVEQAITRIKGVNLLSTDGVGATGRWLNDKPAMIIPGPRLLCRATETFNFMDSFKDITQIMTIAITGVFVEDIATDEN